MNDQPLRERLFEQETRSPAFEEEFRKELRAMTERKLKPFERVAWSFATVLGLFFVVFFGYTAITAPHGFPLLARLGFVAGAVFGAAWAGIGVWTLRQGSINWLRHENAVQGLTFGFVLTLLVLLQVLGGQMENKTLAILMLLNGVIYFMVFGLPALFILRINRTESALREHLLKVELELAELADTMRKLT